MKLLILIFIIQILIDLWCVVGILANTHTLNTMLEIIKIHDKGRWKQ